MLGAALLLLLYAALTGFTAFFEGRGSQAFLYFVFILIICYSFSSWFSYLANRDIKPVRLDSEETLLTAGRLLFTSDMHWLRRFHFFSLDGKRVAYVEEQVSFLRFWSGLLRLIGLRMLLPVRMTFQIDQDRRLILLKKAGMSAPLVLLDEDGEEIGYFTHDWRALSRFDVQIHHRGEQIAALSGGIGALEFKVIDKESQQQSLFVRTGGVPTEAMELFSNGADIIDLDPAISEQQRLLALGSLVALNTYYQIRH